MCETHTHAPCHPGPCPPRGARGEPRTVKDTVCCFRGVGRCFSDRQAPSRMWSCSCLLKHKTTSPSELETQLRYRAQGTVRKGEFRPNTKGPGGKTRQWSGSAGACNGDSLHRGHRETTSGLLTSAVNPWGWHPLVCSCSTPEASWVATQCSSPCVCVIPQPERQSHRIGASPKTLLPHKFTFTGPRS